MDSMDRNLDIVEMMASSDVAFQGLASAKFTYFTDDSPGPSPQLLHIAALKGNATLLKAILEYKVPADSKDQVIIIYSRVWRRRIALKRIFFSFNGGKQNIKIILMKLFMHIVYIWQLDLFRLKIKQFCCNISFYFVAFKMLSIYTTIVLHSGKENWN